MIGLTRRTGERCRLDPDHIERVEGGYDTVVITTDGSSYCVRETVDQVIGRIVEDRAGVIAACYVLDRGEDADPQRLGGPDTAPGRTPPPPCTPSGCPDRTGRRPLEGKGRTPLAWRSRPWPPIPSRKGHPSTEETSLKITARGMPATDPQVYSEVAQLLDRRAAMRHPRTASPCPTRWRSASPGCSAARRCPARSWTASPPAGPSTATS